MEKMVGKVALRILRELKAREQEYREDREEWYRTGDGRRPEWYQGPDDDRPYNYGGKGYSYPYCPHGMSLWTDYDNICGGCEDGYSVYQLALWEAKGKVAEYNERTDWLISAPKRLPKEMQRELIDWAIAPIK